MRALAVRSFRAPVEMMDLPKPQAGQGEILVHLGAASVNPIDWKLADGAYEGRMPHQFPLVLGVDGAGVVEGVGAGVTRFKVGDGVYGQFFAPPAGRGTYAEFIAASEALGIAPIPRGIYTAQASAVPTAGMTALSAVDALELRKGQSLFVLGAKGGVGSFVTQLASNAGILVSAGSRGDHGTYLRKLGAFEYIDTSRIGFEQDFRYAHPQGVDAVLDLVHPPAEAAVGLAFVRDQGIYASTRMVGTPPVEAPRGIRTLAVNLKPEPALLERLSKEISVGRLRIPVESQRPLAEGAAAIEQNRAGETRGKTVLLI
jgi:NADPH:quinone reductase